MLNSAIALEDVLKEAPRSMAEESILLTGLILRADSPDRFTLQHQASSRSVYSVFRNSDVIGPVIAVPHSLAPLSDLGQVIHAVRLKKGAPGILFSEGVHRVGDRPHEPAILKEYSGAGTSVDSPTKFAALDEILDSAPRRLEPAYGVFPGVIHPGQEQDEILLQVNPPGNLDYAIIKRADIVGPGSISELPQDSLPLSRRGHRIHLVRVREGATIRAITGMQARIERQPSSACGCSCSDNPDSEAQDNPEMLMPSAMDWEAHAAGSGKAPRHHAYARVLAAGRRCRTALCLNARGKWDYCCANEWDTCDYQWATGTCTTANHWLWGVRCFCAAKWAPL
jgi:hypothetical protein